jgi:hypothetical protein
MKRATKKAKALAKKKALPTKKQLDAREAKRANAYANMEPHIGNIVRMGQIASMLFDNPDEGLFIFAVTQLEDMLLQFRRHYYAEDFELV